MKLVARTVAVAAFVLFAASTAAAQTLQYDAGASQRYVRTQKDHVVQTLNGAEQVQDIESYWRFAATTEDGGEGVVVSIVHDSVSISPQSRDLSGIQGLPIRVHMSPRGEVSEVALPDSLPAEVDALDLRTIYSSFFPVLPAGEAGPGTTWSDTTEVRTNQQGLDVTIQRINDYTVAGPETVDGRDAVRIDFESTFELEGSGNQGGAEISLSGTGSGDGRYFVQSDPGLYLGGGEDVEMTIDAFVSAGGQNLLIPIAQTRSETIDAVE